MSKLNSFNPKNLEEIRIALEIALKKVEEQFCIKIDTGKMSYSDEFVKCTLGMAIKSDSLEDKDLEGVKLENINRLKMIYGEKALKKIIKISNKNYMAVGHRGKSLLIKETNVVNPALQRITVNDIIQSQLRD